MKKILLAVLAGLLFLTVMAQSASPVKGEWYTEEKRSVIRIYESNGKYYGKIIWVKDNKDARDEENPDKSKRNRKIVGLVILKGFEYDGDGEYSGGTVYDPESGKTYKAQMKLKGSNKLEVRGYVGVPSFGRSTIWTRK